MPGGPQRNRSSPGTRSVILAHHHALLREGLAALLEAGEYQVVAQADNGSDILSLVEQHSPNMVLMEWKAPGVDEFLIRELAGLSSGPVVVLMTRPESSDELGGSLQAGVSGCLSVNLSAKDFLRALRILAEGDLVVSHEMAAALLDPEDGRANAAGLTPRELEVLRLVAEGATNREIGQELLISQHTAKVHVRRVLSKLGLRNRQQAAAYAASQGLTR